MSRKITNANSVAILSTDLPSWKPTWWFTAERSLLFVHSAPILATKLVPLESICEPTTHSGEKHFSCDQCNYSCNNAGSLKKHMRQHSGEKLFVCNKCSLTCTTSSSLRTHMLSHTGGKPFACKKCSYTCIQPLHLRRHMKKHPSKASTQGKQDHLKDECSTGIKQSS